MPETDNTRFVKKKKKNLWFNVNYSKNAYYDDRNQGCGVGKVFFDSTYIQNFMIPTPIPTLQLWRPNLV